ncbi:cytochrome P450 [Protofrankia coriariae]|uniref:Cytochrome P450 n=1 Tax=Protofrankia coriariae TaxID=1562887 RepID=A0ABR5F0C1_9ACTN|nr:cytochrome P450 [Protofrankia coriariae]KLL10161.1 cytochrome P450 [Protofrankia coriariae]
MSSASASDAPAAPLAFGAFDPARRADPYPSYRALRAADPFYRVPLGDGRATVLTRYPDCVTALSEAAWGRGESGTNAWRRADALDGGLRSFLRMNPPSHTRLRGLVSKAFTPRVVAAFQPRVTSLVDTLIDAALARGGEIDLIDALARPLPLRVICDLLGVPARDEQTFRGWANDLTRGIDPDYLLTPDELARRRTSSREFDAYFTELIAWRRARPAGDLLSELVAVRDQGDVLSESELLELCALLLVAGYETTVNLIGNAVLALLRNPDQLALLRTDLALIPSVIDETLRYDPPIQLVGRLALRDTEIAGHAFHQGEIIIILSAAAQRDPDVFTDPDRFDITRYAGAAPAHRHLGFGLGIHYCLGAPLARLEARIALRALVQRAPGLTLAVDPPPYRPHLTVRSLAALPVRLS